MRPGCECASRATPLCAAPARDAVVFTESPVLLIAPDKFKGTLTAAEVAAALAEGVRGAPVDAASTTPNGACVVETCPVADGGEGTLAVLAGALRLVRRTVDVQGPLGEPVRATFGQAADASLAVVELAEASGLWRVPPEARDPTRTSSFGTGQLVREAIEQGARRIVVALGGSATCDGGVGLAQALGVQFLDAAGAVLPSPLAGSALLRVASWSAAGSLAHRFRAAGGVIEAAVDVDSPLCGPAGAARIFAPQKGATPAQVDLLELAMAHLVPAARRQVDAPGMPSGVEETARSPGAGAAGGCGFGLATFCGAILRGGAALVLDALDFQARVRRADLVVAGEGRFDASSLAGKASMAVVECARRCGVPAIVVAGEVDWSGVRSALGPTVPPFDVISLVERFGRQRAMEDAAACLREVGAELAARESR